MKKSSLVQLAAFAVAGVLSQGALAAPDGTVNFTGEIIDSTCSISPSSQNLTVPLGKVMRTAFEGTTAGSAQVGKKSTPAKFSIDLLGCNISATTKNAVVSFAGTADLDDSGALRLTNSGQVGGGIASGVAIEIEDSAGARILLNGVPSASYPLGAGDNSLKFQAVYIATKSTVTVGQANGVAQFTVGYK